MTSINAGGAFYRVQNSLNQNSESVSKSMQRLASGKQNIAPGDRTASSAVAWGMKAEAASLKVGIQNGTEALQAVEMVNNDIQALNDIVVRLEELHALGTNGFNTTEDKAALDAEALALFNEMNRIVDDAKWKGNVIVASTANANKVSFGRNTDALDITLSDLTIPITGGAITSLALFATKISEGDTTATTGAAAKLLTLKTNVDAMSVAAGALYNEISNTMSHLGSLNAGYSLDVASKMDVDFAGETTELAKGQILAQAGTAMLAQANAQGQGMLALIQS
ncbi:flagellin [Planktomarina temperata]|jgi:flagellin|nr:flagellin [Planktomarina temperata]